MCISARDDSLSWPMQMSSSLAIICRAAKQLPVFPRLSPFKTLLSPRTAMHCRPQKRMASETHLTMCLFLIIFFLFSSEVNSCNCFKVNSNRRCFTSWAELKRKLPDWKSCVLYLFIYFLKGKVCILFHLYVSLRLSYD